MNLKKRDSSPRPAARTAGNFHPNDVYLSLGTPGSFHPIDEDPSLGTPGSFHPIDEDPSLGTPESLGRVGVVL
jgi:hypothetical protein